MADRRKELRNKSTSYELALWTRIRNSQLGVKFKRQYSVMNYVVDFYCAKARLAIEVDGNIHHLKDNKVYDKYRTRYIESLGIKEIRFSNHQIENNIDDVINTIKSHLPPPEVRRGK